MTRTMRIAQERLPLRTPFRIARGVKDAADVVIVQLEEAGGVGHGEAVPYARYGETHDSVAAQLAAVAAQVEAGASIEDIQGLLPPGAARNALDCAAWDLAARRGAVDVAAMLRQPPPQEVVTAVTVSLDTPRAMAVAARALASAPLLKVKVDAEEVEARVSAVRAAAPNARLIVDPNESWTIDLLTRLQPMLRDLAVDLVEQPLSAGEDAGLQDIRPLVPICADESCHTTEDLDRLAGLYQVVNIKLDKTGGLTEALRLRRAARERGFGVMIGCMVCSSLAIAPALHLTQGADFIDLDGPLWLAQDREGGARISDGRLTPPDPGFWGGASSR